jgi:hypothetical protein
MSFKALGEDVFGEPVVGVESSGNTRGTDARG